MLCSLNLRRGLSLGITAFAVAGLAHAHSFNVGDIRVDHPYAMPTPGGIKTGAVYFRTVSNKGKRADRLLSATSVVAERIELHRMVTDMGVMRMRQVDHVTIPPGDGPAFRHGQSDAYHLMLINLRSPLKEGERFSVRLKFEIAGEKEVTVWVQNPKGAASEHHKH